MNRSFYPSTSRTTSGRADSSILQEIPFIYVVTKLRHGDTTLPRTTYQVCSKSVGNATPCHQCIILDTSGTTCTFYEIEKRKETKKKQKQRRQIEIEEEKKLKMEETNCRAPPRRGCGRHLLEKNQLAKKKRRTKKNITTCKQSKTKNQKGK